MNEQWNNALDQVKDEFLSEAVSYRPKRHWPRVVGAVAAALVLVISWAVLRPEQSQVLSPTHPIPDVTVAPSNNSGNNGHSSNNGHNGGSDILYGPTTPTVNTQPFIDDNPDDTWACYDCTSYEELQAACRTAQDSCLNTDMMLPYFGDQAPEILHITVFEWDIGDIPWTWYWTSYSPEITIRVAAYPKTFEPGCSGQDAMYQLCPDAPNLHNREEYAKHYPQIKEQTITTSDGKKTALMKYSEKLDRYFLSFTQNGSFVTIAGDQSILDPQWLADFHLVPISGL